MCSEKPILPLEDILVVALEQAVAAPLCTSRLQKAGARVIKIERASGDFARDYDSAAAGESSYFTWTNQGKESLTLDIKSESDQTLLRTILSNADIFVQNLAPGALKKLALDGHTLLRAYPKLITCNISGYGESDSVSHLKAYDLLVQAESGLISVSGHPQQPGRIGISLCDIGAGVTAHAAILEALIHRGVTGKGAVLDISLFDVAAEWMTVPFIHQAYGAGAPPNSGLSHPSISPYGAYKSADGTDTLISIQNEREWQKFCEFVLLDKTIATDPIFCTNSLRVANRPALDKIIKSTTESVSATEFRRRLTEGALAFGGLNSVAELCSHPALRQTTVSNSNGTSISIPAHPYSGLPEKNPSNPTAIPTAIPTRAPRIGEHSASIREEFST